MVKSKKGGSSEAARDHASIALASGFLAVPVSIARAKTSKKADEVTHWVYVRKHVSSGASSSVASTSKLTEAAQLPAERTLFMANLPVDTTESHLRDIFAKAGNISSIRFRRSASADEEDEHEEKGQGEDSTDDEEEHHQLAQAKGKRNKGVQKKSRVPRVEALPSLDPREAMGSQALLTTSSSAHIVFLEPSSLVRALELLQSGIRWTDPFRSLRRQAEKHTDIPAARATTSASFLLSAGAGIPPVGLELLLGQYSACRPELSDVQAWADSRVALYQYRRAHPLPRKIGVRGVTVGPTGELLDEDGFIIVQRSGKYGRAGAAADAGGSVGVAKHDFKPNTKNKAEGLEDFYRFQMRERKRQQLADLRAKFEADKQKVASLKAGRRFKPY